MSSILFKNIVKILTKLLLILGALHLKNLASPVSVKSKSDALVQDLSKET